MSKKEYVISMTVMPWEMEQFIEMTTQLRRNSYYLNLQEIDFIFDVTFNLSDEIIDWDKSKLPKQYYVDQFNGLMTRGKPSLLFNFLRKFCLFIKVLKEYL